jgi:hypothetical protein
MLGSGKYIQISGNFNHLTRKDLKGPVGGTFEYTPPGPDSRLPMGPPGYAPFWELFFKNKKNKNETLKKRPYRPNR